MFPLSRILERARTQHASRPAVREGASETSYAAFAAEVARLAAGLAALGARPGDRVAILARNGARFVALYFACARAGVIAVPLNFRLAPDEIAALLDDCEPRLILASTAFRDLLPRGQGLPPVIAMDADATGDWRPFETLMGAEDAAPAVVRPDDIAAIYYTGGSTGRPKGVCLSHGNLFCSGLDSVATLGIEGTDSWLHCAPLFHLASAGLVWAMPMVGAVQVAAHFEPAHTAALIARERITMTAMPSAMAAMLAQAAQAGGHDMASLRRLLYGGAPTAAGLLRALHATFGRALTHVFAMTENSTFVTCLPPEEHVFDGPPELSRRTFSAGRASHLSDFMIIGPDGAPLPPGTAGEIVVRGPKVMRGYWRRPTETAAALVDGWLRTGDIGMADEAGFLFIVDRAKDMIITGGENVYPAEVETVISLHPDIAEVAVIGIPDERWGEAVTAIVVPRPGAEPSPEAIIAHCRAQLGGFKVPKRVEIRAEALPRSGVGKIAKAVLRAPFWSDRDRPI